MKLSCHFIFCAISLNVKKFYILPTEYLYVLYVSQKKMKYSLYSIRWLIFMTKETSVYCAERNGSLNEMN
jgi:hypothetical protein